MGRWPVARLVTAAALACTFACGGNQHGGPDGGTVPGLTVATTAEGVSGSYAVTGVEVKFAIIWSDDTQRAVITRADDSKLIDVQLTGDKVVSSLLGGRLVTTIDIALVYESQRIAALPKTERPPFSPASAVEVVGDRAAASDLIATPEYAVLPYLSRALGQSGYTGAYHPAMLLVHRFGMRAAADLEIDPTAPPEGVPAGLRGSACVDLRSDPNNNQSFGMCGPSSTCWEWVCGDCCCHKGCESHDSTCRNCKWYKPWNCLLCATFASFLAGGCDTCNNGGGHHEPTCANLGQTCSEDVDCCYLHEGSTERRAAPREVECVYDAGASEGRCRRINDSNPFCGDGACNVGEDCDTCPVDCGCTGTDVCQSGTCVTPSMCGNGTCGAGENCSNCNADCGCTGGKVCQAGSCVNPPTSCGDNTCQGGTENCSVCPSDCPCPGGTMCQSGVCVDPLPYCGDNACEPVVEDCGNCPGDCPCPGGKVCQANQCVDPAPYCGDNACEPVVEDCGNCPGDCPCPGGTVCQANQCVTPPPVCGDGSCAPGEEDCGTCPVDCPCPGGTNCMANQCM